MKNNQLDGDDLFERLSEVINAPDSVFVLVVAVPTGKTDKDGEPLADYSVFRNGCAHEADALLTEGKACLVDELRSEHRRN